MNSGELATDPGASKHFEAETALVPLVVGQLK